MDIVIIFYIILLFSASVLCIALVVYIGRITNSVKEIEADVSELSNRLKPLIENSTRLTEKLNNLAVEAEQPVETTKGIVNDIRDRVDKILELESRIRRGFEDQFEGLFRNLSAVKDGVSTFWKTFKNK